MTGLELSGPESSGRQLRIDALFGQLIENRLETKQDVHFPLQERSSVARAHIDARALSETRQPGSKNAFAYSA